MAAPARVPNSANQVQRRAGPPAAAPAKPAEDETPPSRLSWFVGWILVPGVVFGGIFGGGVLVGAHYPDGWIAWAVRGVASLIGG